MTPCLDLGPPLSRQQRAAWQRWVNALAARYPRWSIRVAGAWVYAVGRNDQAAGMMLTLFASRPALLAAQLAARQAAARERDRRETERLLAGWSG